MNQEQGKTDVVQVCPQCMGTKVETTTLGTIMQTQGPDMRNDASCLDCGWAGKVGEMASIPFTNPFGNATNTVEEFGRDVLMTVVKECAEQYGRTLIRWGFMDGKKIDKQQFSRYLAAIAKASALAIIATRSKEPS